MTELPSDVARNIAKGVAAYIRATPVAELPPSLATLKKTLQTPKGEARHRERLLAVLDDDVLRALVAQWLDDGKTPLGKEEAAALELASRRPDGWLGRLSGSASPPAKTQSPADPRVPELERRLAREKEAHRKARDEVKRLRDAQEGAGEDDRRAVRALQEEVSRLTAELTRREKEAEAGRREIERIEKEVERRRRKSRADLDEVREQVRALKETNKTLRKELSDARRREPASTPPRSTASSSEEPPPKPTGPRRELKAPKGRLAEDPATLTAWLKRDRITLVVDGYNVTRHAEGYGHLSFEQQRDRLRDDLKKLANRARVPTVLVWDGGDVPPGTKRRKSGFLREEYSEPDRSGRGLEKNRADRHIVGLVKGLPPDPVIVVTSDRGLQEEVAAETATIATSEQLLALLR